MYDATIKNSDDVKIDDNGIAAIQELSIDEFLALSNLVLIPQTIEQNQHYLFEGNVKDDTIIRIGSGDDELNIDSRTYRRNGNGNFVLFSDTTYTNPKIYSYIEDISKDYYLDKYANMNNDYQTVINEGVAGRFAKQNGPYAYGGEGVNIDYRFITTNISVHDQFNMLSNNAPYTTPHS
uniref:Crassvirus muzzle protein N-terminal region domain-containing protein n=1 Tax=Dulem virus 42 TaxID=3145760 RepID=A0AAU8BA38_9CAUD